MTGVFFSQSALEISIWDFFKNILFVLLLLFYNSKTVWAISYQNVLCNFTHLSFVFLFVFLQFEPKEFC